MKKTQTYVAGVLALLCAVLLAGVAHLVFIFPRTMAGWADEGRALPVAEQALANLSNLCKTFGLLLIPILLLAVIGFGIWAVLVAARSKQESANQQVHGTQ